MLKAVTCEPVIKNVFVFVQMSFVYFWIRINLSTMAIFGLFECLIYNHSVTGKRIFIGFTVDTDCVYINFNLLVQVCLVQKKIALGDQREFILANCYFKTIKQIPTTVFENENSFKIYLVIIMLNMHKHVSKKYRLKS